MRIRFTRLGLFFAIALFVVAFGIPSFTSPAGAQDEGWQLVRAMYGFRDAQVDVTALLRDLIARSGFNGRIAVSNQTMGGDPAVGKDKTLHILARNRRGEQREFNFQEGAFIDATMFVVAPPPRDDWGDQNRDRERDRDGDRDLYIIRGYYGTQGRTVNVTNTLRARVRDGRLFLDVNNEAFGGDPAVGADKVLIVIYRFRGEEQAAAVREGNRLAIP